MKKIIKFFFVICIIASVIILLYTFYTLINKDENVNDYVIIDNTEVCAEALESIYIDDKYIYYLPCIKSNNIYLKWTNGEIHKMIDDLNSNKVTIGSLIDHGLEVIIDEN